MKRKLAILFLLLAFCGKFLAACNPADARNIGISVIDGEGSVVIKIEEQDYESNIVVDILKANNDRLQIPQSQLDSGFIVTIAGTTAVWGEEGNQWWWKFDVNGEFSSLGIRDARVEDNSVISFTLVEEWA